MSFYGRKEKVCKWNSSFCHIRGECQVGERICRKEKVRVDKKFRKKTRLLKGVVYGPVSGKAAFHFTKNGQLVIPKEVVVGLFIGAFSGVIVLSAVIMSRRGNMMNVEKRRDPILSTDKKEEYNILLKSSCDWEKLYSKQFKILDPDGWDRHGDFGKSWNELISEDGFLKRMSSSTCEFFVPPFDIKKIRAKE